MPREKERNRRLEAYVRGAMGMEKEEAFIKQLRTIARRQPKKKTQQRFRPSKYPRLARGEIRILSETSSF